MKITFEPKQRIELPNVDGMDSKFFGPQQILELVSEDDKLILSYKGDEFFVESHQVSMFQVRRTNRQVR